MTSSPSFADLTTIGVGGEIARFSEPTTRVGLIEAIEDADRAGIPLCMLGGGSNMLVGDAPFHGVVIRDGRRDIVVPDEADPVEDTDTTVHLTASAGANWDDFVEFAVSLGLEGVEGLSGIPGTVGASVVQNIGAYGQEVATSVESVEVWDRKAKVVLTFDGDSMRFGYRTSALKQSMFGEEGARFFPSPRYVVLSVTFVLRHSPTGTLAYPQLAKALNASLGDRMNTEVIRGAVLRVRAAKGMLEDPARYNNHWMSGMKREENIARANQAVEALRLDDTEPSHVFRITDRHSCGSFFINPQISAHRAEQLPDNAPKFGVTLADGQPGVKTSAAWLIDHAGFHRGFRVSKQSSAALSSVHTLALTNTGGAKASEVWALAHAIQDGVRHVFGIDLIPEPVVVGLE
ncbi:FAD-binding protein [Bifidobacterium aquikefiri]|uniref:FAD-binding protein n=1 Tax=Bifidobacterium aquikefiri TaxID=1653207 RepID=UPI0023F30518|nr:FAD-binding protein [Bifidobacterium aquikefiri]